MPKKQTITSLDTYLNLSLLYLAFEGFYFFVSSFLHLQVSLAAPSDLLQQHTIAITSSHMVPYFVHRYMTAIMSIQQAAYTFLQWASFAMRPITSRLTIANG